MSKIQINNQSFVMLLIVIITFGLIKGVNFITLENVNSNSEYRVLYESKLKKGYLTEEDVRELEELEQAESNDLNARAETTRSFFGTLFVGMMGFLLLSYVLSKAKVIKGNKLIVTLAVVITAFLASSLWQSMFWGMFFYVGLSLGLMGKRVEP